MKVEVIEHHGGDYHIVDVEEPNHGASDPWYLYEYMDVDVWCAQTFGPQDVWGSEIVSGWKRMRNRYYLVGEDKLSLFLMRWA